MSFRADAAPSRRETSPALVTALRTLGHDVVAITELARGSADVEVARRASAEGRIIITFDKDSGELAVRHGLGGQAGVVLLRFVPESPDHAAHLVLQALAGIGPIEGRLVVIERERVRLRALGSGPVDRGSPAGPDGRSAGMIPRLPRRRRRAPATMSAEAQHASGTILHQKTMSKELASPWANSPWAASSSPA